MPKEVGWVSWPLKIDLAGCDSGNVISQAIEEDRVQDPCCVSVWRRLRRRLLGYWVVDLTIGHGVEIVLERTSANVEGMAIGTHLSLGLTSWLHARLCLISEQFRASAV
jgi:hypothetical protein